MTSEATTKRRKANSPGGYASRAARMPGERRGPQHQRGQDGGEGPRPDALSHSLLAMRSRIARAPLSSVLAVRNPASKRADATISAG